MPWALARAPIRLRAARGKRREGCGPAGRNASGPAKGHATETNSLFPSPRPGRSRMPSGPRSPASRRAFSAGLGGEGERAGE